MSIGNATRLSTRHLSKIALCLAAAASLSACAGIPPSADEMAKLPVVRYGQPAPADKNFVLLYPAGAPLPVVASVKGDLLQRTDEKTLEVSTKRDIYTYREWVSFDGKTWERGDNATSSRFEILLPGGDGVSPGKLSASFDKK
ncbi:hypothetical protein [Azospirillum sp. sgz302134]